MTSITIYSTPTCPYCNAAKAFFKEKNLEFKNIDVSEDPKAVEEMVAKSGQMGVPVIILKKGSEEKLFVGFQKEEIAKFLGVSL